MEGLEALEISRVSIWKTMEDVSSTAWNGRGMAWNGLEIIWNSIRFPDDSIGKFKIWTMTFMDITVAHNR